MEVRQNGELVAKDTKHFCAQIRIKMEINLEIPYPEGVSSENLEEHVKEIRDAAVNQLDPNNITHENLDAEIVDIGIFTHEGYYDVIARRNPFDEMVQAIAAMKSLLKKNPADSN